MTVHLVIGASGLVGYHLVTKLTNQGEYVLGTYAKNAQPRLLQLYIQDFRKVSSLIEKVRPNVVYLPASLTNVDYCETHPEEGYATNVVGVRNVVNALNRVRAKLVYFSSDYIFDGKNGPYFEDHPAYPICEYGHQKLMAEHYIALHAADWLIIRTTVVYGWEPRGKNFICRLVKTLRKGEQIRVPDDQIGSPTYAPDMAEAVFELVRINESGVFHVVGSERVSRYRFALYAAGVSNLDPGLIQPVSTKELGQLAARPLMAGLRIDKVQKTLRRRMMGYKEGLERAILERDKNDG